MRPTVTSPTCVRLTLSSISLLVSSSSTNAVGGRSRVRKRGGSWDQTPDSAELTTNLLFLTKAFDLTSQWATYVAVKLGGPRAFGSAIVAILSVATSCG